MEGEGEREGVILCCIIFVQDMKVVLERKKNAEAKEMEKLERKKQLELLKEQVRIIERLLRLFCTECSSCIKRVSIIGCRSKLNVILLACTN